MARKPAPGEKPVDWIGSSLDDLKGFPPEVKNEMGVALSVAQFGGKHPSAKPWTGLGPGTFQIKENFDGNAYRAVYTVEFSDRIYVLHAFQKKSVKGMKTPEPDKKLIERRYREAKQDYQARLAASASAREKKKG